MSAVKALYWSVIASSTVKALYWSFIAFSTVKALYWSCIALSTVKVLYWSCIALSTVKTLYWSFNNLLIKGRTLNNISNIKTRRFSDWVPKYTEGWDEICFLRIGVEASVRGKSRITLYKSQFPFKNNKMVNIANMLFLCVFCGCQALLRPLGI